MHGQWCLGVLIHLMPFLHTSLVLVHIGFSRHAPHGVHHFSPFWYRCFSHQNASLKGSQQSTNTRVFLPSTKPHLSFLYLMTHWLHDLNLGFLFLKQYFSYFATLSLFFFFISLWKYLEKVLEFLWSFPILLYERVWALSALFPTIPLCMGFGSLIYPLILIPQVVL